MTTTTRFATAQAADALVGSDEGTHGKPGYYRVYETVTGKRYATYSFAGANATRCTEEQAKADTDGRIVKFPKAQAGIREAQAELKRLQTELRRVQD